MKKGTTKNDHLFSQVHNILETGFARILTHDM